MSNQYYTYAYLREDGTPYYVGKGKGRRAFVLSDRRVLPPKDRSRILFLKKNLTEPESIRHEVYMIAVLGRKDKGTGILRNMTDGGDGMSGYVFSEESKEKLRVARLGKKLGPCSEERKRKIANKIRGQTRSESTRQLCRDNCFKPNGYFWATNGNEEKWCPPGHPMPDGWKLGRKPISDETRERVRASTQGENNPMHGVEPKTKFMRWYKNLSICKEKMFDPTLVPDGWTPGRLKKHERTSK